MTKKKQFLVRNACWNKHFTNFLVTPDDQLSILKSANELVLDLQKEDRIQYCVFSVERGRQQNDKSFHFQGYIEFSRLVDGLAFKNEWKLSDIQARRGTQEQAITYVKKERTKLLTQLFEFGTPKKLGRELRKYNTDDPDIRSDINSQKILLDLRLNENYYPSFTAIKQDFNLLFLNYDRWCKNLWNLYHPTKTLDVQPAQVIWVYGPSGVGKTTWTNNFLKENGYSDRDICSKKASNDRRPKLWFDLADESASVLWIEEVRPNFPDFNDLIQLIDKRSRLEVKGSHIDNNFNLIIINSIYLPEEVFTHLSSLGHRVEILRRIYLGHESKVYELVFDSKNHSHLIDRTALIPKILILYSESFNKKRKLNISRKRKD